MISIFTDTHNVLLGSVFMAYFVAALTGLIAYARQGLVDYRTGILLAIPTVPGVVIGTFLESSISNFEFKLALGLLTIALALMMHTMNVTKREPPQIADPDVGSVNGGENISAKKKGPAKEITDFSGRRFVYHPKMIRGILINFAAGLLSGTFGAGAAIIIVPSMVMFIRLPSHVAIATSRIVLLALNLSAVVAHVSSDAINYYYALIISLGAIVGIFIGSKLVFRMVPLVLTRVMVILFVLLGVYLVISSL
jgi:uncharacterized membrane protein YfcA